MASSDRQAKPRGKISTGRLLPVHFPPTHPLLPPAPAAYQKSGSGLFIGDIWHESEDRNEELRTRAIRNLFSGVGNSLVFRRHNGAGSPLLASGGSLVSKCWYWFRGDRLESAHTKNPPAKGQTFPVLSWASR